MELDINIQKLSSEIEALALISEAPSPAVTRVLYTDTDRKGRSFVIKMAQECGLEVVVDAIGNIFMIWKGTDLELPPVATGSHTDAIPFSGKYDGVVGVLGAIEAVRALKRQGYQPVRTIELIMFTAEEPTRFGIGCLGSRALCGDLLPERLLSLTDDRGAGFDEVRKSAGHHGDLSEVVLQPGYYHSFIELHIEQGPRLEQLGVDIGVVTDIAAPATIRVTLDGEGGHAGAVLMPDRKDALIGAAKAAVAVQEIAINSQSNYAVATVGKFEVFPGAVNSIPSTVKMEIDVRDIDGNNKNGMVQQIEALIHQVATDHELSSQFTILNSDAPASCDQHLLKTIENTCVQFELKYQRMISHAYHDALFMSQVCPTAMIFVPSTKGYSHRPEEFTSPEQIAKGVKVLAQVLARLSAS